MYNPDAWVAILINNNLVKIFCCWYGGYTSGDIWRMNSGCSQIIEREDEYSAYGYSGSEYILTKGMNRLSSYGSAMLAEIIGELDSYGHTAEIISIEKAMEIVNANSENLED